MGKKIELTREELYQKVWSTSVLQLSKEFGISDVGFAKICKRHNIPRPSIGYWAKVANGIRVSKVPLPKPKKGISEIVVIKPYLANEGVRMLSDTEEALERIKAFKVPERVRDHPVTAEVRRLFRKPIHEDRKILLPAGRRSQGIRVTSSSLEKALRILNLLFVSLESLGYEVAMSRDKDAIATFVLLGEPLEVAVAEVVSPREVLPLTAKQKEDLRRWGHYYKKYDYIPTGILKLKFREPGWRYFERTMTNSGRKGLEDRLPEILRKVVRMANDVCERRRIREEEARKREAERLRRLEIEQRIREEKAGQDKLLKDAENWHASQRLRSYIEAVKGKSLRNVPSPTPDSELSAWLQWATLQADLLDPLIENVTDA